MAPPRVSVIIPCYNTSPFVAEAVGSVFQQTYTNYEVVVVNDGSPDTPELEEALAPWRDRLFYLKIANSGLAGARNHGIRAAHGELIALLDSDDMWQPNYLEVQLRVLDAHPDADIVYPNALNFGDGPAGTDCWYSRGEVTFAAMVRGICEISSGRSLVAGKEDKCVVFYSVLARRAALEGCGLFDDSLRSCEDLDMWLRCANKGSRIIYHKEPLVRYRRRADSLSADPVWMLGHIIRVFAKSRDTLLLSEQERRLVESALLQCQGLRAFHEGKRAFLAGDVALAVERLEQASQFMPSARLRLMLGLLRTSPRLAQMLYRLKQRHDE